MTPQEVKSNLKKWHDDLMSGRIKVEEHDDNIKKTHKKLKQIPPSSDQWKFLHVNEGFQVDNKNEVAVGPYDHIYLKKGKAWQAYHPYKRFDYSGPFKDEPINV